MLALPSSLALLRTRLPFSASLLDALPLCLHVRFVVLREAVGCAASVYDGSTVTDMRRIQHLYRTGREYLCLPTVTAFGVK